MALPGQLSLYKEKYCDLAIEMGREGKSLVQIAAAIDVCKDTLLEWASKHPAFSCAMKKAKTQAEAYLENMLQENTFTPGFNIGIVIFQLKARYGLRDKDSPVSDVIIAAGVDKDTDTDKVVELAKKMRKSRKEEA